MTMTILTTLGALITALIAGALVAPPQERTARAVSRAKWSGGVLWETRSFRPGR
jgi:hypothetical protein